MQIAVRTVSNGFIVEAGCVTLVYVNALELAKDFERWTLNPSAVEMEFAEKYARGGGVEVPERAEIAKSPYPLEGRLGGLRTR